MSITIFWDFYHLQIQFGMNNSKVSTVYLICLKKQARKKNKSNAMLEKTQAFMHIQKFSYQYFPPIFKHLSKHTVFSSFSNASLASS